MHKEKTFHKNRIVCAQKWNCLKSYTWVSLNVVATCLRVVFQVKLIHKPETNPGQIQLYEFISHLPQKLSENHFLRLFSPKVEYLATEAAIMPKVHFWASINIQSHSQKRDRTKCKSTASYFLRWIDVSAAIWKQAFSELKTISCCMQECFNHFTIS